MTQTTAILINQDKFENLQLQVNDILQILRDMKHVDANPKLPKSGGIELAEEILGRSKSWIYKATAENLIPFKKFGSKLLFDRDQLEEWVKERIIDPTFPVEIINKKLAESARKKLCKK